MVFDTIALPFYWDSITLHFEISELSLKLQIKKRDLNQPFYFVYPLFEANAKREPRHQAE